MTEEYTCIECENLYDDTDGDTDERMCDKCLDIIYDESLERKSEERVKSVMGKVDELIDWVKGERRNPNIRRSSTKHYPDWDMKKKQYIVPPNQRSYKMNKRTYDNPKDLLKALLECSKTNINVDWNDADVKTEFQEYVDVIKTHLNEEK